MIRLSYKVRENKGVHIGNGSKIHELELVSDRDDVGGKIVLSDPILFKSLTNLTNAVVTISEDGGPTESKLAELTNTVKILESKLVESEQEVEELTVQLADLQDQLDRELSSTQTPRYESGDVATIVDYGSGDFVETLHEFED